MMKPYQQIENQIQRGHSPPYQAMKGQKMEHCRHKYNGVVIALLLLACRCVGIGDEPVSEPWLRWEHQGEFLTNLIKAVLVINQDGRVTVDVQKRPLISYVYNTKLTEDETTHLRELIRQADFFSLTDQKPPYVTDIGPTSLWINLDGKSHTVTYQMSKTIVPLDACLWGLLTQAEAIYDLKEHGQAYPAGLAVNPRLAGVKAFQPYRLVEPLETFITKSTDTENLNRALEALAWCSTTDQWFSFLETLLKQADTERYAQMMVLLTASPFDGNIPESHLKAMGPLLLAYLEKAYVHYRELSNQEQMALYLGMRMLGTVHYAPALGFLKSVFDSHDQKDPSPELIPIRNMGSKGILLLASYLEHPSAHKRMNATESIGMAYTTHRYRTGVDLFKPVDDEEYVHMIELFDQRLRSVLERLAEKDVSPEVQSKAKKALQEIREEINVWKKHQVEKKDPLSESKDSKE